MKRKKSEPLKFTIGQQVCILSTTQMYYVAVDKNGNRISDEDLLKFDDRLIKYKRMPITTLLKTPRIAFVIGAVRRPLGIYCGSSVSYDGEYEQASLNQKGIVTLYQLQDKMFRKHFEALPEDVVEIK